MVDQKDHILLLGSSKLYSHNRLQEDHTFDMRRTSMMRGRNFKLFEISTIITQRETVILIEPPRKDAAPKRAYLKFQGDKKFSDFRARYMEIDNQNCKDVSIALTA